MILFLRQLVFQDFWLKLFSVVLAVLIWLTVRFAIQKEGSPVGSLALNPTDQRTFLNVPVQVMSSAADVRSFRVSPQEVEVTVQGEGKALKTLQGKDLRVMVDLTGIEAARELRKRIEVLTPAGVTLGRVVPQEVDVIFPSKSEASGTPNSE